MQERKHRVVLYTLFCCWIWCTNAFFAIVTIASHNYNPKNSVPKSNSFNSPSLHLWVGEQLQRLREVLDCGWHILKRQTAHRILGLFVRLGDHRQTRLIPSYSCRYYCCCWGRRWWGTRHRGCGGGWCRSGARRRWCVGILWPRGWFDAWHIVIRCDGGICTSSRRWLSSSSSGVW